MGAGGGAAGTGGSGGGSSTAGHGGSGGTGVVSSDAGAGDIPANCTTQIGTAKDALVYDGTPIGTFCSDQVNPPHIGSWFSVNDGTGRQTPPIGQPIAHLGGRSGSTDCAVHTLGTGFTDWGGGIGLNLNLSKARGCAYDASIFKGIRLYMKGTATGTETYPPMPAPNTVRVGVVTISTSDQAGGTCVPTKGPGGQPISCDDHYGAFCTLATTWSACEVAFANPAFTQEGWGVKKNFSPAEIQGLLIAPTRAQDATLGWDFWVDDVSFY
jgi:hypothetical protein